MISLGLHEVCLHITLGCAIIQFSGLFGNLNCSYQWHHQCIVQLEWVSLPAAFTQKGLMTEAGQGSMMQHQCVQLKVRHLEIAWQ